MHGSMGTVQYRTVQYMNGWHLRRLQLSWHRNRFAFHRKLFELAWHFTSRGLFSTTSILYTYPLIRVYLDLDFAVDTISTILRGSVASTVQSPFCCDVGP